MVPSQGDVVWNPAGHSRTVDQSKQFLQSKMFQQIVYAIELQVPSDLPLNLPSFR
jgi:hypothetical protein